MRTSQNVPTGQGKTPKNSQKSQSDMAAEQKGRTARQSGNSAAARDEWGSDEVRQGHISGRQFMFILAYTVGTKVLYLFPTTMSTKSGSSAWLSVLVATVLGLLGLWGGILWVKRTGGDGFVVSLRKTCGRVVGDSIAVFTLVVLIMITGWSIRLFVGGAVVGVVPDFPIEALIWISALSGLYPAWLGIEAVGRAAGFFFAPTLVSIGAVMLSLSKEFHLANLTPLWGLGTANALMQGVANAGMFGGVMTVAIIKSYFRTEESIANRSVYGTLIAAAVLILSVVVVAGIFPYPMSIRKVEPLGIMARSVYMGRFIQRIEALFIFSWYFSTSVQASFFYTLILILMAQLSGTGTYRPFAPAVAVLTFGIAGIPANTLRASELMDRYFTTTAGNIMLALGWVLYVIAVARGVRGKSGENGGGAKPNGKPSQQSEET